MTKILNLKLSCFGHSELTFGIAWRIVRYLPLPLWERAGVRGQILSTPTLVLPHQREDNTVDFHSSWVTSRSCKIYFKAIETTRRI